MSGAFPHSPAASGVQLPRTTVSADVGAEGMVTAACCGCGRGEADTRVHAAMVLPAWLAVAAILAIPLLLDGVVKVAWGGADLYSVMAGEVRFADWVQRGLRAAPVVIPAAWLLAVLLGWVAATPRLRLAMCRSCASRSRRARAFRLFSSLVLATGIAAALYGGRVGAMDERRWSILFAPWVAYVVLLESSRVMAGARWNRVSDRALMVMGAPALSTVLAAEKPGLLVGADGPRISPPPRMLVGWVIPVGLALAMNLTTPLEALDHVCPFGTWPLAHRSGPARLVGCHAATGERHGFMMSTPGGWNTSSPLAFAGDWYFGQPDGAFRFADREGKPRAVGSYRRGEQVGRWQLLDEHGTVLEDIDVETGTFITTLPALQCPPGTTPHLTGTTLWGTRSCRRGTTNEGPSVDVQDAVVARVESH